MCEEDKEGRRERESEEDRLITQLEWRKERNNVTNIKWLRQRD